MMPAIIQACPRLFSNQMELEDRKVICKVCLTQFARYICPRCNISYCSLACYKQHSSNCTEAFYRDQAVQQLQGTQADRGKRGELLALLKRAQKQREQDAALFEQHAQHAGPAVSLLKGPGETLDEEEEEGGILDEQEDTLDEEEDEFDTEGSTSEEGGDNEQGSEFSSSSDLEDGDDSVHSVGREADQGGLVSPQGTAGVGAARMAATASAARSQPMLTAHGGRNGCVEASGGVRLRAPGTKSRTAGGSKGVLSRATLKKLMRKLEHMDPDAVIIDESDLTPAELQAFHRSLAAGRLSHLLTPWQPWWLSPEARTLTLSVTGQHLIQTADSGAAVSPPTQLQPPDASGLASTAGLTASAGTNRAVQHARPAVTPVGEGGEDRPVQVLPQCSVQPLPPLSRLTRAAPSPLLRWQLIELLYAYCYVQRRYNGEAAHPDDVHEAASTVLHLSPGLAATAEPQRQHHNPPTLGNASASGAADSPQVASKDSISRSAGMHVPGLAHAAAPPANASQAVHFCLSAACQPPVGDMTARSMAVGVLGDVVTVLEAGLPCVVLALTDLHRQLTSALELLKQHPSSTPQPPHVPQPTTARHAPIGAKSLQHVDASQPVAGGRAASKRSLMAAAAKVWFFMCWANDQRRAEEGGGESLPDLLAAAVRQELQQVMQQAGPRPTGDVKMRT